MHAPNLKKTALFIAAGLLVGACGDDTTDLDQPTPSVGEATPTADTYSSADTITYRELASHPGCTTADLTYPAADIPGYSCAAKAYDFPEGIDEDTDKPILLLIHGNSDTPDSWEKFPADDPDAMDQLAEQAVKAGIRTYAIDLRIDKNDDPKSNNETENAALNVDHGWATPLAQHFMASAFAAWPDRRFSVAGFSLGATVIRDALRRMHNDGDIPFAHLDDVLLLAGANHGVSTYYLCGSNPTMRGEVTCQMGDRDAYSPTDFMIPLNGPDGIYEAPCSDGDSAFGLTDVCGGNTVEYTTIVMKDISDGTYQDLFVSEASSALNGADNQLLELTDVDESLYFYNGLFQNHYGAARSEAALSIIMDRLND